MVIALEGGRWEIRKVVRHWIAAYGDEAEDELMATIEENLDHIPPPPWVPRPERPLCPCGCLLIHACDPCPACAVAAVTRRTP